MQGGLLVGLMAMASLAQGPRGFGRVELHSVPDEEVRTTPFATIDSVAAADAALVLECGRENGDVVSGRKTGAWVRMTATGKAAHAGTEPENGRSAIIGLCRELSRCHALNGAKEGLTVNAGVISGGTIANVVPEWAEATLDVRTPRLADFQWAMEEIARVDPMEGVQVRVEDAGTWPGIEPGPAGRILLREAQVVAEVLGFAVAGQTTGGMSDGCWTAARGTPTLDGLGPIGGQDHSPREYARLDSVPSRCGLVAGLCAAIGGGLLAGAADPEGVTDTQLQ